MKLFTPKILATTALILIAFAALSSVTHAASLPEKLASALTDVAYTAIGKLVFVVGYVFAFIAGIAISILAWAIGVLLTINSQLIQSDAVQVGFSVSLAIANLGFVIGIIVIAIATMLRRETYGIKQILWKLVAAAILVNFSLVITAPIINFANQLTTYFLNCSMGSCSAAGSFAQFDSFASSLAGAFNPQKEFIIGLNTTGGGAQQLADSKLAGAFALVGSVIGKLLVPITSVFFVAGMLTIISITLTAFIVMLFVRYITLGILLVIMPFAWLMWIFPTTSHLWSKWWNTFWRWTFFAPIVIFFLYLAMLTSKVMSQSGGVLDIAQYTSTAGNTAFAMLANVFGSTFTPLLSTFMQQLIIIAWSVGGLFVADKLSIHGAHAAMDSVRSVKGAVQGFLGRKARVGARYVHEEGLQMRIPFTQTRIPIIPKTKKLVDAMQKGPIGVSAVGRGLASAVKKAGGGTVNEILKEMEGKSSETLVKQLKGYMSREAQFAALHELVKREDMWQIHGPDAIRGQSLSQFLHINQEAGVFDRFDQKPLYEKLTKIVPTDEPVDKAMNAMAPDKNTWNPNATITDAQGNTVSAQQAFNDAMAALARGAFPSDINKGHADLFFKEPAQAAAEGKLAAAKNQQEYEARARGMVRAFASSASAQTFAAFMQKLAKGGHREQLARYMREMVDNLRAQGMADPQIRNEIFSAEALRWLGSNAAQNLGIDINDWMAGSPPGPRIPPGGPTPFGGGGGAPPSGGPGPGPGSLGGGPPRPIRGGPGGPFGGSPPGSGSTSGPSGPPSGGSPRPIPGAGPAPFGGTGGASSAGGPGGSGPGPVGGGSPRPSSGNPGGPFGGSPAGGTP